LDQQIRKVVDQLPAIYLARPVNLLNQGLAVIDIYDRQKLLRQPIADVIELGAGLDDPVGLSAGKVYANAACGVVVKDLKIFPGGVFGPHRGGEALL
jgi:ribulose 1,5-bisphosphate synthetase/thiazole synthase